MAADKHRFSVYSRATHSGRAVADENVQRFASEEAARDEFQALERRLRTAGSTEILWLVELRDGDSVIESFDRHQKPKP